MSPLLLLLCPSHASFESPSSQRRAACSPTCLSRQRLRSVSLLGRENPSNTYHRLVWNCALRSRGVHRWVCRFGHVTDQFSISIPPLRVGPFALADLGFPVFFPQWDTPRSEASQDISLVFDQLIAGGSRRGRAKMGSPRAFTMSFQ